MVINAPDFVLEQLDQQVNAVLVESRLEEDSLVVVGDGVQPGQQEGEHVYLLGEGVPHLVLVQGDHHYELDHSAQVLDVLLLNVG